MATVYFKNRIQAGQQLASRFGELVDHKLTTVVSLSTEAVLVAAQVAAKFSCPLQLYLSEAVALPGNEVVGGVNQDGNFTYGSDLGTGFAEYYEQDYRGYLEEAKRATFSAINRELGSKEIIRHDLLKNRHVIVVTDCLDSSVQLDSFISYLKTISYQKLTFCSPILMTSLISHIEQKCDESQYIGDIEFFYGADHYFEDNTVVGREHAVEIISNALKLWR